VKSSGHSGGLEEITMRAMEPDLNKRYASADEMLHDLEEFRKNPATMFRTIPAEHFSDPIDSVQDNDLQLEDSLTRAEPVKLKPVRNTNSNLAKPGMTNDEYRRSRRRSGRTATLIGIFCVIIFLVLTLVFMWRYFLKDMLSPEEHFVTTPNFVGQYYDDVITSSEYTAIYNFAEPKYEYNDRYAEGYVIFQSPAANRQKTLTEDGIDVELTVSMGKQPDDNTMPNLVNMDYRLANIQLQNLGLNLDIQIDSEFNEDVTELYVIRQIP
jgi:serine/threonine-protein kinase